MSKIYLVMTSELLSDDAWHDDTCRAFKYKKDADFFMQGLVTLHRANKHIDNPTRFWVQSVPYSDVKFIPEEMTI